MKHISSTQLLIYANCSRQYYFHYIEKIIKPTTSPNLIYGSSLHKVLEILNKSLISTPLTEKELLDISDCRLSGVHFRRDEFPADFPDNLFDQRPR